MDPQRVVLSQVLDTTINNECVIPIVGENTVGLGEIGVSSKPRKYRHGEKSVGSKPTPVKINLQDCLSCSGCVTSAETVLLESQGKTQFDAMLREAGSKPVIVSLSLQAIASFAQLFVDDIESGEELAAALPLAANIIAEGLKRLGVCAVVPLSFSQRLSCEAASEEFLDLVKANARAQLFVSACPGWVCLAQKRYPDTVARLARAQSSMTVFGTALLARAAERCPGRAFSHVSIQPCYDRKLEAIRPDTAIAAAESATTPATTLVLGTHELFEFLLEKKLLDTRRRAASRSVDSEEAVLGSLERVLDGVYRADAAAPAPEFFPSHTSGGYCEQLAAALVARGLATDMQERPGRNPDVSFLDVTLSDAGRGLFARPTLVLGRTYSLRNIYNLAKTRAGSAAAPAFVEVMACPHGCLFGGAQIQNTPEGKEVGPQAMFRARRVLSEARGWLSAPEAAPWAAEARHVLRKSLERTGLSLSAEKLAVDLHDPATAPPEPNQGTVALLASDLDW
eukprot:gnl/Chilomastix_cuspidata/2160.p1 GENE.gnl/Chilomastix_cuspidata/2160~~gnl/Chilomastix_cuspidata/2160.p1  ORF type:complete len:524 (+),score=104.51 gnl/Chilomastix_cuspidata/2160:45-1574(+)